VDEEHGVVAFDAGTYALGEVTDVIGQEADPDVFSRPETRAAYSRETPVSLSMLALAKALQLMMRVVAVMYCPCIVFARVG